MRERGLASDKRKRLERMPGIASHHDHHSQHVSGNTSATELQHSRTSNSRSLRRPSAGRGQTPCCRNCTRRTALRVCATCSASNRRESTCIELLATCIQVDIARAEPALSQQKKQHTSSRLLEILALLMKGTPLVLVRFGAFSRAHVRDSFWCLLQGLFDLTALRRSEGGPAPFLTEMSQTGTKDSDRCKIRGMEIRPNHMPKRMRPTHAAGNKWNSIRTTYRKHLCQALPRLVPDSLHMLTNTYTHSRYALADTRHTRLPILSLSLSLFLCPSPLAGN